MKDQPTVKVIWLQEGESMPDPSSTKRRIFGPARVIRTTWPDGGIDITYEHVSYVPYVAPTNCVKCGGRGLIFAGDGMWEFIIRCQHCGFEVSGNSQPQAKSRWRTASRRRGKPFDHLFGAKPDHCPEKIDHCSNCNVYPCTIGRPALPGEDQTIDYAEFYQIPLWELKEFKS